MQLILAVTTIGDQFLSFGHFVKRTLYGVGLRMAIPLGNYYGGVPRNPR